MYRGIRVLHPLSAWGGAHVQTCINLLRGMASAGRPVHLDLTRTAVDMGDVPHSVSLRGPLARRPLNRVEPWLRRRTEARFLARLQEGDVAWLWPEVTPDTYEEVARRGHPIIMEGINTRIASAREILMRVYDDFGAKAHYANWYSDGRMEAEERMLSLATHFFAPSPGVEAALAAPGSSFSGEILPSSYGAWWPEHPGVARAGREGPVTFLFMGTVGLRKNAHGLLKAWADIDPSDARLVLCGAVEPVLGAQGADLLSLPSVEARGHVRDVAAAYREADVFVMPSFEEGDPQVTYEAAGFGLPIIASPMGGGRLADRFPEAVTLIDPWDPQSIAEAVAGLAADAGHRLSMGARAREAARHFDWNAVGRERAALLEAAFGLDQAAT